MLIRRLAVLLIVPILLAFSQVARADTIHIVQPGDTMWEISQQYGVPMDDIVAANNLGTYYVMVGYPLIIPGVGDTAATPTPAPAPAATVPATAVQVDGGVMHTVQAGDNLFRISLLYGVPMDEIAAANNLENIRVVRLGQELFIPGAKLPSATSVAAISPSTTIAPAAAASASVVNDQLLPNSSFEEGWHFYLFNELQVPDGWQLSINEGPNTVEGGSGGTYNRPEMRVVTKADLPDDMENDFVFDGNKTVKSFKGGAPTTFAMYTDQKLQPGRYRMTVRFFPDIVVEYKDGKKVWATDPLAAEARVIVNNGGTPWTSVTPGQRGELSYEFTVSEPGIVRVGGDFRNALVMNNNGWFLDSWSLKRIGD